MNETSERWKLKNGERYAYVDDCGVVFWCDYFGTLKDEARVRAGNCYKTRYEAESVAKRVQCDFKGGRDGMSNREILFRGKYAKSGEWLTGDFFNQFEPRNPQIYIGAGHHIGGFSNGTFDVERGTVGQFTGIKDKNDKPIFEGDVVVSWYGAAQGTRRGVIIWDEKYCAFMHDRGDGRLSDLKGWIWNANTLEVIGNIHDDPTLMWEGEK